MREKKRIAVRGMLLAATSMLTGLPALCWGLQLELPDRAYQGDLIVGRVKPPASIFVNATACGANRAGYFATGVARNQKTDLSIKALTDSDQAVRIIRILAFPWSVHRIDGLPEQYVTPPQNVLKQIEADNLRVASIRISQGVTDPLFLKGWFAPPVNGPVTGLFGSKRILNGKPRSPHSGVDFAAPEGSPVHSPAGGVVALVTTGAYLMGNVLMIDHGLGVRSILIHLQRVLVSEGDRVRQGQVVALVGKTGRATGPHLHWGVSVGTILIDPTRLFKKSFRIPR